MKEGQQPEWAQVTRAFRVEGHVQGVGFRWWTVRMAERLGLKGWVRNLPDGAVEVHLAGVPDAVDEMAGELGRGPSRARVDRVSIVGVGVGIPPSGFEVR